MLLIASVTNIGVAGAFADTKGENEAKFAEKVKADVARLGTGVDAKVTVKLKDGTKLKGYVSEAKQNSFVIVEEKTGRTTEVPYNSATQVKGRNLSAGVKIAITAGIIALIVLCIVKCRE